MTFCSVSFPLLPRLSSRIIRYNVYMRLINEPSLNTFCLECFFFIHFVFFFSAPVLLFIVFCFGLFQLAMGFNVFDKPNIPKLMGPLRWHDDKLKYNQCCRLWEMDDVEWVGRPKKKAEVLQWKEHWPTIWADLIRTTEWSNLYSCSIFR